MSGPAITRWVRFLGLAVVLAAAAVLSFHGLRDLALAVSIPAELAWLLPVAVDAGAGVSCACWLSRDIPADAARFARTQTWLLLGGTVIGNAAQLGMHAAGIVPPWWVAVLVGAIPPAVVGGTIHLAVLVGRTAPTAIQVAVGEQPPVASAAAIPAQVADGLFDEPDREPTGADRPEVDPPMTDAAIYAEVREWAVDLGRPPSRDQMIARYRIGATRAQRLRRILGWADAPTDGPTAPTEVGG